MDNRMNELDMNELKQVNGAGITDPMKNFGKNLIRTTESIRAGMPEGTKKMIDDLKDSAGHKFKILAGTHGTNA